MKFVFPSLDERVVREWFNSLKINTMAKINLNLESMTDHELLELGRRHQEAMRNNPHFPNPQPSIDDLDKDLQAFSDSIDEVEALETELAQLKEDVKIRIQSLAAKHSSIMGF